MSKLEDIKGIINMEALELSIKNNEDPYGKACVDVAINVMRHLETFKSDFNIGYHPDMTTTHAIICECDDQGGISGFMAGAARNIVANCYKDGWKFYLADVINSYNMDDLEECQKYIKEISKEDYGLVSEEAATLYVSALVERYKKSQDK